MCPNQGVNHVNSMQIQAISCVPVIGGRIGGSSCSGQPGKKNPAEGPGSKKTDVGWLQASVEISATPSERTPAPKIAQSTTELPSSSFQKRFAMAFMLVSHSKARIPFEPNSHANLAAKSGRIAVIDVLLHGVFGLRICEPGGNFRCQVRAAGRMPVLSNG